MLPIAPAEPPSLPLRSNGVVVAPRCDRRALPVTCPAIALYDIPLGEHAVHHSRVTDRQEFLPAAVVVVGAPGLNGWVLESVETVPRGVIVGR